MSTHRSDREISHVENRESVLNLFLVHEGTRHENLFLQYLVALVKRFPESFLVAHLENLVSIDEPRSFDVHRSTDFAHAHVPPWVVLYQFSFLRELEILQK